MKNIVGSPVEDGDFFGREAEVAGFVDLLLQGNDILLLGPRRIGKTSIARAVMRTLAQDDWQVIELNVATCRNETDFVQKLVQALRMHAQSDAGKFLESVREGVSGWLHRIEGIEASIPGIAKGGLKLRPAEVLDWTEPATGLLQLLAGQQRRWLIYIDELP
ncbi:ATP-binding protein, partial [Plasticicumulans sp.]|uniref:ATP-binding protein n=1 Tax=Plasticicumulans sp. TaxID=2307179 RepID=UPI0032207DC7